MKQENKNFIYNVVYQFLIYLFPLITIPYISRVLGVENIGIYSFTFSIVSCLMLFSMLGINNYGNREISKNRDERQKLSKIFFSIYSIQFFCSLLMLIIYILYIIFLGGKYKLVFFMQTIHFISVFFDINWLYFGLEQFKLTIKRNIVIKIISTIGIFVFVKDANDLLLYTFIMGLSNLLAQLYLFTKLKKYIDFVKVTKDDIKKHIKNCLVLFVPVLAYSIYRIMDKTMIGYLSSVTELGYYENAEKIINIPISIITALGTVMLPRMSYLIKNDKQNVTKTINQSLKLAILLSANMMMGLILISKYGSVLFLGEDFAKSGLIIKLLSVTIIISAWASVFRTQYLIPTSKDKIYVYTTISGAIINLILNLIFIPLYGSIGACIGTICAELALCVGQSYFIRKEFPFHNYLKLLFLEFIKSLIIFIICYCIGFLISSNILKIVIQTIAYIVLFFAFNYNYILNDFFGIGGKDE